MFVSGSEVAWDLDAQGNTSDQTFIHTYLKARYGADDSESYTILGEPETHFSGLVLHFDDGNDGVYEENYPDAFVTTGGSEVVLRYSNNLIAATAYTGLIGPGSETGQIILLGIPFETIYQEDQQLNLMTAILEYFGLSTVLPIFEHVEVPQTQLQQSFPSPFNSSTQIRFQVGKAGIIDLRVYDLLGREIRTLSLDHYEAGIWQLPFYADTLPSGIYIVQLHANGFHQSQKIIHLK